jgi:glycogen(starch) synthase
MRIIIFSWEYPPRVVGKLSEYVKALSTALAEKKVDVNIVTYDNIPSRTVEPTGVKTVRVSNPVHTHIGVLTWVLTLNQEVERAGADVYYEASKQVDIVDAYDWHFIPSAVTMKYGLDIPFVYSVESLEDHRSNFANNSYNMAIKSIEWLGFYEASVVAVKTQWMLDEIVRIYKVPKEKIKIVSSNSQDKLTIYDSLKGGSSDK